MIPKEFHDTLNVMRKIKGLDIFLDGEDVGKKFRSYVEREEGSDSMDMKNSFAYTLQASRNLPFSIEREEGFLILGKKENEGTVVVPNYFMSENELRRVVRQIRDYLWAPVILKNVSPVDVQRLKKIGFDTYQEGKEWSKESPYDDQTYPQQIISIPALIEHRGSEFSEVRKELNHNTDVIAQTSLESYNDLEHLERLEELCKKQEKEIPGFLEAHQPFLRHIRVKGIKQFVVKVDEKVEGLAVFDKISERCAAFNACVHNTKIPFLSTTIAYLAACEALREGYLYFNLQGSETEGLDKWKRKFNPVKTIEKTHLIYRG